MLPGVKIAFHAHKTALIGNYNLCVKQIMLCSLQQYKWWTNQYFCNHLFPHYNTKSAGCIL